ncbi:MAG: rubrerythrin family protein [Candidatus Latescibacterota bacterium]|nr:MAG: rubrerythrin family protein [Candidatus Latescibacterota bacterium]HDI00644.1 rubrerythrin family protein [Bacillota bacterium]
MRRMTEEGLRAAFAGESQAHMRYLIFAQKAEEEGYPNIARLFRAISFAEQVHATNHFRMLGDLGSSADNLDAAIGGETFEVEEMYPAYDAVAELQGEKEARRSIHYALEAEKIHAAMYSKAKEAVKSGKDLEVGKIYICSVCGYTGEGEPPDRCPICGATKDKFRTF